MFQLLCQTCGEDVVYDEFERCQEQFNDHVARSHEVELIRMDETTPGADADGRDEAAVD